ncbi:MAG: nucleotidyltransferase domain-containing protein [Oscillospiraceae bacterium]|nr:nucleotidyltransferase domain-containing protein [Oscillospiraceae bacterium]
MQTIDIFQVIKNADKYNVPNLYVSQLLGISEGKVKLLKKLEPEDYQMVLNTKKIYKLVELKEKFLDFIKSTKVSTLILTGSYARGLATEDSDIDIIIESDDIVEDYEKIYSELSAILEKHIDIMTVTGIENSVYRESLLEGSILIYGKGL